MSSIHGEITILAQLNNLCLYQTAACSCTNTCNQHFRVHGNREECAFLCNREFLGIA